MLSALVTSTLLAGLANAASISKRENDGNFFSDLSLRTVGARNTLVSNLSIKFGVHRLTSIGLAGLAREGWEPHLILA